MSIQTGRLAHLIEREISEIVRREASNKQLKEVTITDVKLNDDKSVAKVYYTILDNNHREKAQTALENATGYIRSAVAEDIDVRKMPELRFVYDESIEYGERIEKILSGLNKDK